MSAPPSGHPDVLSHSGFSSWISSFTPASPPPTNVPAELPAGNHAVTAELPAEPVDPQELPAPHRTGQAAQSIPQELDSNAVIQGAHNVPQELDANVVIQGAQGGAGTQQVIARPPPPPKAPESTGPAQELESPVDDKRGRTQGRDGSVMLNIAGLRQDDKIRKDRLQLRVARDITLLKINELIRSKGKNQSPLSTSLNRTPGCEPILGVSSNDKVIYGVRGLSIPCPVLVTDGPSNYCIDTGLRINIDEPVNVFLSRLSFVVTCEDNVLRFNNSDLKVSFHRTLRIPEDAKTHSLPASLGRFPLNNIAPYAGKLKASGLQAMAAKGGVFFPMYQREAMWISFENGLYQNFQVKLFVGGVNAISGLRFNAAIGPGSKQDYMVVPPQKWLDGIVAGSDTVRQFVAMPIGSGYSIEKQVTGREDLGGLQLQITPEKGHSLQLTRVKDGNTLPAGSPREHGFQAGQDIYLREAHGIPIQRRDVAHFKSLSKAAWGSSPQWRYSTGRPALLREIDTGDTNFDSAPEISLKAIYKIRLTICYGLFGRKKLDAGEYYPWTYFSEILHGDLEINGLPLGNYDWFHLNKPIETDVMQTLQAFTSEPTLELRTRPRKEDSASYLKLTGAAILLLAAAPLLLCFYALTCCNTRGRRGTKANDAAPMQTMENSFQGSPDGWHGYNNDYGNYGTYGGPEHAPGANYSAPQPDPTPPSAAWDMGIAAGGRLAQRILADPAPQRSWAVPLTTLVNIQILNSVAFESLTGMLAPPTPITVASYLEAGYPFYRAYGEKSAETWTGAAAFEIVRSVSELDEQGGVGTGTDVSRARNVACVVCTRALCDCM
ncbi:hypothetical protein EJ06DRAFT_207924 [Trichodelitschia bisporula]|uniref:Uncharacterized protein n=1 Tax=Trichodelitschia bisporula TaxID=703511 RepID=A0A6G1I913_9PEZI|nr:hypothetical protein EJ06DRAFT_207924 [Trichodelitschia bisporula]